MKLKEALKKFSFVKVLELTDVVIGRLANHLSNVLKGSVEVQMTPLAMHTDPLQTLVEWDVIFSANTHRMNQTLLSLEKSQRSKFGPRSIAVPWTERASSISSSYSCQDSKYDNPLFYNLEVTCNLKPLSKEEASFKMNGASSSGLPFLTKKSKTINDVINNFDMYLKRKDPAMLYTRTDDSKKTRNVWGYPFADTLLEIMFYTPLQEHQRSLSYRSALVGPDDVAKGITKIVLKAIKSDCIIYSVDFAGYDASIRYQYIIKAFDYIERCFNYRFATPIRYMCERFYSISIVTPDKVCCGKHGVPSGSGFTNEVDSIIQAGIALLNDFVDIEHFQVQGDDGVYMLDEKHIKEFEDNFVSAGLQLQKQKSFKSKDFAVFCQNLYHNDYINDKGIIDGIYPIYRALNHLLFQERFVEFAKSGMVGKDYYGIRALSILENCKYHPLFEEFVRFVLQRERYALDISEDGLMAYCNSHIDATIGLNQQYGANINGIRGFASFQMVAKIIAEEGWVGFSESVGNVDDMDIVK